MKNNFTPTKPPLKKRRRKRGRPAKNSNPVGRPKKFADPVDLHLILEKRVVDYFDSVIERLMATGTKTTRGDIIRLCISKMIK
jgi:hypothetical protein